VVDQYLTESLAEAPGLTPPVEPALAAAAT